MGRRPLRRAHRPHLLVAAPVVDPGRHAAPARREHPDRRARHRASSSPRPTRPATGSSSATTSTSSASTRAQTVEEQERRPRAPRCGRRDPDRCCALRKVEPLERALVGMDAWITGIRRAQSPTRAGAQGARAGPARRRQGAAAGGLERRGRARATSSPTTCPTTRFTIGASPRSAARTAPGRSVRARTRARDAGRTPRRPSAGSTCPPRPRPSPRADNDRGAAPKEGGTRVSDRAGFTLWFTGLSGTGKTTIAEIVGPELERRGALVEYLDGDVVRTHLSKGLGFSKEDRDTNIGRIGWVASRFTRAGVVTLVSAISPYAETRAAARGDGGGVRPVHRGVRGHLGRGVRQPRRQGPLRQGVLRRDQGVHGRERPVRGAREPGRPPRAPRRRPPRRAPRWSSPSSRRAASSAERSPRSRTGRQGRPPLPHPRLRRRPGARGAGGAGARTRAWGCWR